MELPIRLALAVQLTGILKGMESG